MLVIEKRRTGPKPKYPWDLWTDGNTYVVEQGKEFQCQLASFITAIHYTARSRRMVAETSTDGTKITFAFHPMKAEE